MTLRSEPGLFLSGDPMPPPGPERLRPSGCVAVVSVLKDGARLSYEHDAEQARLDKLAGEE